MSSLDYLDLCRLCLVKDRVSVPIFEDEGDVRQIFLKITACLPVKVSREDKLPKKICDDCVYKVELFYQFWNTTANAEKQLLQWLGEVGGLEDNQSYVTEVLDSNVMKQERSSDSRLDGSVMQVGGHQNNMDIGMIDNMSLITMPTGNEQFTSVPMDTANAVQTVQAVAGSSTQTSHDQITQNQTAVTHLVEEEEESEDEENSDDGCDNEEGLPVKEETEEDPSEQPLEPTTFVNVSIPCDEAGPSGLQQQKISEISELTLPQTADGDSKTGSIETALRSSQYPDPSTMESSPRFHLQHYCGICLASFSHVASLADHLRHIHNVEHPFECDICGVTFRSPLSVTRHKRTHLYGKRYSCELCSYACHQKSNLELHRRRHANNYAFRCDACGAGFMQRTKYLEHKALHEGKTGSHKCQFCGKTFNYKRNLVAHVKCCHPESRADYRGPLYECSYCPSSFVKEQSLRRHVKTSHASLLEPPEKCLCDLCGAQLSSKTTLVRHVRSHRGEKVASCDTCGKSFTKWENLRVHKRIHTGERPYLCSVCGKGFIQRTTLVQHLRLHTGERPYRCNECGKGFVSGSFLRKHAKSHSKN